MRQPHRFSIGQNVVLTPIKYGAVAPAGTYIVVRLLPNDDLDREYRLKHQHDGHERVVRESQLRAGPASPFN
ncbi:hypothetical protein [Teichococcus vastitatis]|jgi:hypothetical protein|uniref:Uncharacterized protein n=1 Tax=Teichococcus vastitatis TaxID=2307076 RepID=A0ABS9W6N1_9PROT|nr:hypothetical protein [Pseudoroseomonas vastitatis]MCI0754949.1 hypothetical protein [Pseudoroseomonas vastitatis]